MLTSSHIENIEALLRQVGADEIKPRYGRLGDADIAYKGVNDPFTVADTAAENALRAGLKAILPDSLFIGEESYNSDPDILQHLSQSERPVWVVDPIDGTRNFMRGEGGFGIMAALVYQNRLIGGWLYNVWEEELIGFTEAEGLHCSGQGEVFEDFSHSESESDVLLRGCTWDNLYNRQEFKSVIKNCDSQITVRRAAGPSIVAYPQLLLGEVDFILSVKPYPWDHLPGMAMAEHLGGVYANWSGEPFDFSSTHQGLIVAKSQEVLEAAQASFGAPLSRQFGL